MKSQKGHTETWGQAGILVWVEVTCLLDGRHHLQLRDSFVCAVWPIIKITKCVKRQETVVNNQEKKTDNTSKVTHCSVLELTNRTSPESKNTLGKLNRPDTAKTELVNLRTDQQKLSKLKHRKN